MLYKITFIDNCPGGTNDKRFAYAKADDIKKAIDNFYASFKDEYPHITKIETLEREKDIGF